MLEKRQPLICWGARKSTLTDLNSRYLCDDVGQWSSEAPGEALKVWIPRYPANPSAQTPARRSGTQPGNLKYLGAHSGECETQSGFWLVGDDLQGARGIGSPGLPKKNPISVGSVVLWKWVSGDGEGSDPGAPAWGWRWTWTWGQTHVPARVTPLLQLLVHSHTFPPLELRIKNQGILKSLPAPQATSSSCQGKSNPQSRCPCWADPSIWDSQQEPGDGVAGGRQDLSVAWHVFCRQNPTAGSKETWGTH